MGWGGRVAGALAIGLAWGVAAPAVQAGPYPDRPVRLVVPYPPGGGIDPSARVIAEALAKTLHQSVYVDNQSGASGRIGTGLVARAKPDGYTLLYGSVAPNVIIPAAYGDSVDYPKKLQPIALAAQADYILLSSVELPVASLPELVAYARQHPQTVTYASSGLLGGPHLAGELLGKLANVQLVHVPYRGNGPAMAALLAGEVLIAFDSAGGVLSRGKSDRYKVLAVTGGPPPGGLMVPDLGTLYPGHDVSQWYGLFTTAGVAPEIVAQLHAAIREAVNGDRVKEKFTAMGLTTVLDSTPESFAVYVDAEIKRWHQIIATNNIEIPTE
jgi:tripartite-type tricarboxylate transporter receptor subunit TctC